MTITQNFKLSIFFIIIAICTFSFGAVQMQKASALEKEELELTKQYKELLALSAEYQQLKEESEKFIPISNEETTLKVFEMLNKAERANKISQMQPAVGYIRIDRLDNYELIAILIQLKKMNIFVTSCELEAIDYQATPEQEAKRLYTLSAVFRGNQLVSKVEN